MKQFLTVVKNLVFPPRCAGCHTLLPPTAKDEIFCAECAKEWRAELCLQCPVCYAAYPDCRCQPGALARVGSKGLLKLAPYGDSPRERVMHRIVLDMKKRPHRRTVALLARELAVSLSAEMERLGWDKDRVFVVHLPRDKRSVRREGADQSEVLARALAREMGLRHLPLLYRKKHVEQQKTLSLKQRAQNLQDVFGVRDVPKGALVLLVDDVVTTGASLCACARVLRAVGVCELYCVALAQTQKKH